MNQITLVYTGVPQALQMPIGVEQVRILSTGDKITFNSAAEAEAVQAVLPFKAVATDAPKPSVGARGRDTVVKAKGGADEQTGGDQTSTGDKR